MAERFAVQQVSSLTKGSTRLRAIANNALKAVKDAQEETVKHIIEDLQANYDTAIPGDTYERTGNLGLEWEYHGPYEAGNGKIRTDIENHVIDESGRHYSGIVQGESQTQRHEGAGWRTVEEIRNDHLREQTNRVRAAIRRAGNA